MKASGTAAMRPAEKENGDDDDEGRQKEGERAASKAKIEHAKALLKETAMKLGPCSIRRLDVEALDEVMENKKKGGRRWDGAEGHAQESAKGRVAAREVGTVAKLP